MSEKRPLGSDSLPLSRARRVDEVCSRFEDAWITGRRPAIEAFLGQMPEPEHTALVRELIALEIHYRRLSGDDPQPADYQERFPKLDATWLAQEVAGRAAIAADPSTIPGQTSSGDSRPDEVVTAQGPIRRAGTLRYRPLRFHAKGALGEVFVARDEELHRDVALKRIQRADAAAPEVRRRFLAEAEITARLEHPGIVPVYGLVEGEDGQPCYAMRFIQGESLREAIQRFHEAEKPSRDAGERSLALRHLLSQFLTVCNTVAYAHSRGILHRDLKPANIMLGTYGETLVVDWGLAKAFERDSGAKGSDADRLARTPDSPPEATQLGQAVGTPAYMSPEQAAGRWDQVGPASDIYSLGATLYTILTGEMPFQGDSVAEVLDKVQRGEVSGLRQWQKEIPRALEAICLKAMARQPEQRYATALEIAADLEHWLADEPVLAYREPLPARMLRWGRRHRTLVAGAAVLLITAVVALTAGIVLLNREKERTARAYTQLEQAQEQTRQALAGEAERLRQIEDALSKSDVLLSGTATNQQSSPQPRQSGVRTVPDMREQTLGIVLSMRKQLVANFPTVAEHRQRLALTYASLGYLLEPKGGDRLGDAEAAYRDAIAVQKELAADFPADPGYRQDLANSYSKLSRFLRERRRRLPEAEAAIREDLALRKQLAAEFPTAPEYRQRLAQTYHDLANLLGSRQEAESAWREALAVRKQLATEFPTGRQYRQQLATSYTTLAEWLKQTGRLREAEATFRDGLPLLKELAAESRSVDQRQASFVSYGALAQNYASLGELLASMNRLEDAEAAYRDAVAVRKQFVAEFPNAPAQPGQLASSYMTLGNFLQRYCSNRLPEAESTYRDAVKILEQLVPQKGTSKVPGVPHVRLQLARGYNSLGHVLIDQGKHDEAEVAYRGALKILEQVTADFPGVHDRELVDTVGNLVALGRGVQELLQVRRLLEHALPRLQEVITTHPTVIGNRGAFRQNRMALAFVLAGLGEHAAATAIADELALLGWDPAWDCYTAASALSRCAAMVEKDAKLPVAERSRQGRAYADRAVELLGQAVAKGYKNVKQVETDKDLDPLRSRADFQKLLTHLKEQAKQDER